MSDKRIENSYLFLMEKKELQQKIYGHLLETGKSMLNLSRELGFSVNTVANFMNGKGMSSGFYKALERYFDIKILEKIVIKKEKVKTEKAAKEDTKPVIKNKTFIKPWMIRNLKNFGNTGVGNLSKKRTPEMVVKEFAKFGIDVRVDENEVVWLKGKEND